MHCFFCIWYFHRLKHRNKLVHKIVMVQWINSSSCNMIFMTFMKSSFHTLSRRFVGFNNAGVFCLTNCLNAVGFPVLFASGFAKHCSWHRNFQLSSRIFHNLLEFFVSGINEVNTTQLSGIVKLRFFDSPLLPLFSCRRFRHIFLISGHKESGLEVVCFLVSLLPRPCIPIRWCFIQYRISCTQGIRVFLLFFQHQLLHGHWDLW